MKANKKTATKKTAAPKSATKKAATKKTAAKKDMKKQAEVVFADLSKLNKDSQELLKGLLKFNIKDKMVKSLAGAMKSKKVNKPQFEKIELFLTEVLSSIEEDISVISDIRKNVKDLKAKLKSAKV